jgi:hypothetical protein
LSGFYIIAFINCKFNDSQQAAISISDKPTNGARVASRSAEQRFMESGDATAGRQLIESMLGDE